MTRRTGGQVQNTSLMQLFSDVCNIPVILPYSHSDAVVVGSAMLGRFAAEVSAERGVLETQEDVEKASYDYQDRLWQIMVGVPFISLSIPQSLVLCLMVLMCVS